MNDTVTAAFPACLAATVSGLSPILLSSSEHACSEPFTVSCGGETLLIPCRIYFPRPSDNAFRALHDTELSIVACWFTRHHDGYVRERFLRSLTAFDSAWIIAYVVALCGEYVIELLRYIWDRRELFDRLALGRWLHENEAFYRQTRSRIVSYWNCYYRSTFPCFTDYVGSHLVRFFDESIINSDAAGHV
ncbi:conserved hypothetical protein [Chthoniobacter flavus Ellin428]|uniref:Uncharacterized protein n=1 Tax=Chthoniobacter flavus Ellin428 TaxID=497964 RepID=B4D4X2_9BACT|nr:hypothetical protein [Chthoniobacter flavus]EDY18575.1 conserved hypothetical protein [Chthoniobacter flavus Ellin428]TCO90970.1 hypothetical protein EV701_109120 [Chthoniobacter flavus]